MSNYKEIVAVFGYESSGKLVAGSWKLTRE